MRAKTYLFRLLASVMLVGCAQASTNSGEQMTIEIKNLIVDHTNKTTRVKLRILNLGKTPLRVSQFNLGRVVQLAEFIDSKQQKWEIGSDVIDDPPEPRIDYSKPIGPGKSLELTIGLSSLRSAGTNQMSKSDELTYSVSHRIGVRVADTRLTRFWTVPIKCGGKCEVK